VRLIGLLVSGLGIALILPDWKLAIAIVLIVAGRGIWEEGMQCKNQKTVKDAHLKKED
jgi:hypothetical protein